MEWPHSLPALREPTWLAYATSASGVLLLPNTDWLKGTLALSPDQASITFLPDVPLAAQAGGSVTVHLNDTIVFAAATMSAMPNAMRASTFSRNTRQAISAGTTLQMYKAERWRVVMESSLEVGPSLFVSLLIIVAGALSSGAGPDGSMNKVAGAASTGPGSAGAGGSTRVGGAILAKLRPDA